MFKKLGKFEIQKVLGRGAMGEVYLGVDPAIGREVAIKTILDASAQGGEAKERFAREAKAAGVLNHPNLVTIYEFGEDQGVLYIAMEFVRGHDFEELLRDQALTRSELLEVLAQVCDGLDFAHRAGIVHRDIKPTNVRVQKDGRRLHAKVMDFGVARVGNSDMTATGIVMGTVSYMAPEYIRTGKPDPRSDLFAVGVMLYEALSGRKPFSGDTTPTILYKIVNEAPDPIDTTELQGISPAIKAVMDRALCKDPDQRFQHADEFARALRAAKDPTWSGQMDDGTMRVTARAAAPSAPPAPSAPTAAMAPATVQLNAPTAPALPAMPPGAPAIAGGSKKGLWIGLAALLLAGLGVGGYLALKPKEAQVAAALPAPQDPATDPSAPKDPAKGGRLAAGAAKQDARGAVSLTTPQDAKGSVTDAQQKPPVETKPAEKKPSGPEPKAIDQPQKFEPQHLEKLQMHERVNLGNVSMSESIQLVEKDPEKAIYGFKQAIKADPGNANAYAWLAVVYYEKGRYGEFAQVLRDARRAGVTSQMGRNVRFMAAYRQAKYNNRLPSDLGE
jgi:serine/threonine-protein kinase